MPDSRPPSSNPDADAVGTPYGPHPKGTDQAAGGADSSPFENEASEVQRDVADVAKAQGLTPQSDPANAGTDRPR